MLETIDLVPWSSLLQPEGNQPGEPQKALRQIESVASEKEASEAYTRFLYAVGNDHRGTYYPVVLATVPFLEELLVGGNEWVQGTALNVLIDLVGSFWPEPGIPGETQLQELLMTAVNRLLPIINAIEQDQTCGTRTRKLAAELSGLLAG